MTKIEELEQKLNECQKELAEIQKEITELNELQIELKESKKEGKWKPAEDEIYWFRDSRGAILNEFFNPDHWRHNWRAKNMAIFETREQCQKYWHFMDTVKEKSYEFSKEEWENVDIPKFIVKRNYEKDYFEVGCFQSIKYFNTTYFKTEEDAQYIIDNFKDELMEFWI